MYRTKCQVKQLRCGIIETKTCPLITTGEDAVEVVFLAKSVRGVCMHFVIICPHNFRPHAEDRAILDWTGSHPRSHRLTFGRGDSSRLPAAAGP